MKLEQQVCTEVQGNRLVELGIATLSLWSRFKAPSHSGFVLTEMKIRHVWIVTGNPYVEEDIEFSPVFTVAELGQMLNSECYTGRTGSELSAYANREWIYESAAKACGPFITEAEARADLLIHLLETKVITAEEVNKRLQQ